MLATLCGSIAIRDTAIAAIVLSIATVTTGAAAGTIGTWAIWTACVVFPASDVGKLVRIDSAAGVVANDPISSSNDIIESR